MTLPNPSSLRPLCDLIEPRPDRPETVLTLANAIGDRLATVRAFELPPSVKRHFEMVLDAVEEGRGRAFWAQSEYGGGKTHFIAALIALLAQSPEGDAVGEQIWASVNDEEIRSRAASFAHRRILPVAVSCKGILPVDGQVSRAFLRLLMDGMYQSLKSHRLEEKVPVTPDQEMVSHFRGRPEHLRQQIDAWCREHVGVGVSDLLETEGPERAARAYRAWFHQVAGGEPDVELKVVDWLTTFCRRLTAEGFDGLLVVVDEFKTLQDLATAPPDIAAYQDILEALGWLVPQRLREPGQKNLGVYTIVASQFGRPVKLAERYTMIPLLAQDAARDYEIIVSRRVRTPRRGRLPEIEQYYHHHKLTHETYASMPIERFREVFPFQPRVFDAIWSLTASGGEVAAARFGIAAVWDVLKQPGALDVARLLTVSDLLRSPQFQYDLRATHEYRESFLTYQQAMQAARSLDFAADEGDLVQRVLDALFVDHIAHHRAPRWLTTAEIAEAVLATSNAAWLPAQDQVLGILGRLRQLRQVEFEPARGARFKVDGGSGPTAAEVLAQHRKGLDDADPRLVEAWTELLQATAPAVGIWSDLRLDSPRPVHALHGRVQYQGAQELRRSFTSGQAPLDLGHGSGRHFHIIVLTGPVEVAADDLGDPRVAVIVPGPLVADEIELCRTWVAGKLILDNPQLMSGPDAGALRTYVEQQRRDAAQRLISRQSQVYRRGKIVSRTGVAFNPDSTFRAATPREAIETIVDRLLGAAYDRRDTVVRSHQFRGSTRLDPAADTRKIFASLIGGSTQSADLGAAQNFGPALGLSRPLEPHQLWLDPDHFAVELALQRIAAAGVHGVATESFYEALSGVPYGVPHEIVTLWLLACVRAATVGLDKRHVEVELQNNARARLKGEARVPNNTITFLNVRSLQWSTSLRSDFLSIRVSEEVPFGLVVDYGRVFNPTLKAPTAPEQVLAEEQRLQHEIDQARAAATNARTALTGLAAALGQALPSDVGETMGRLVDALTINGGYEREHLLAQMRQAFPSVADLQATWGRAQGWSRLSSHAAELASLHQFIRTLVNRLADRPGRYQQVVTTASLQVLPRLALAELLASPTAIEGTIQAARDVRAAYENEYRIHHRDYFAAVARLREQLAVVRRRAGLLAQLNKLKCAGPPRLASPDQRLATLETRLRVCPSAGQPDIGVGSGLTCHHAGCDLPGLDPLAEPPTDEAKSLLRDLDDAIRDRTNAVKAKAVLAILERSGEPSIGTFLAVIQAGQLDGLLDVLDDQLIALIDRVLEEERIRVVPTGAIATVARRFNTIQKGQIAEVTDALRHELERAFAEQEQAHPGAVIQLRLALEEPRS